MTDDWNVKPGDIVESPARSGLESPEYGRVLAVLPVQDRDWPNVVVAVLPGNDVQTWRLWRRAKDKQER